MNPKYRDMLSLPHPASGTHTPMPPEQRAAQFAPFAALVGHDAAIRETARLTDRRIEPDEQMLALLDHKWRCLCDRLHDRPLVEITFFQADTQKSGGAYRTAVGTIDTIDTIHRCLHLSGGETIPLCDILVIESDALCD